jgi:hypothetical protein
MSWDLVHSPDPIIDQTQHGYEARDGKDECTQTSGVHYQVMFDTFYSLTHPE